MIRKIIVPLPGNQHAEDAAHYVTEASLINEWEIDERKVIAANAQALATLALAHEQRTANLIAQIAAGPVDMTDWPQSVRELWFASNRAIAERLGQDRPKEQP